MNDKAFQRFVNLTCIYSPCYEKGVVNGGQRMYKKKLSLCCLIYSQPLNPYICKNVRKNVFKAADDIFGPGCMSMIEYCFMKKLAITIS
jgi:hypothetical protein